MSARHSVPVSGLTPFAFAGIVLISLLVLFSPLVGAANDDAANAQEDIGVLLAGLPVSNITLAIGAAALVAIAVVIVLLFRRRSRKRRHEEVRGELTASTSESATPHGSGRGASLTDEAADAEEALEVEAVEVDIEPEPGADRSAADEEDADERRDEATDADAEEDEQKARRTSSKKREPKEEGTVLDVELQKLEIGPSTDLDAVEERVVQWYRDLAAVERSVTRQQREHERRWRREHRKTIIIACPNCGQYQKVKSFGTPEEVPCMHCGKRLKLPPE